MSSLENPTQPPPEVGELLRRLDELLTPENCELLMQHIAIDSLTDAQRDLFAQIRMLSNHVFPSLLGKRNRSESESRHGRDDGSGGTAQERKKQKPSASHQMDKLKKHINLDMDVDQFCRQHSDDPEAFFSDPTAGLAEPAGRKMATQKRKGHIGEYISFQVEYLERITSRHKMDAIRKAYVWLNCYDMVMEINKTSSQKWTGRRFGSRIDAEILDKVLVDVCFNEDDEEEDENERKEVLDKFKSYCGRGVKMNMLCQELGDSCLLRLAPCLTEKFVDDYLKQSGKVHERVMKELLATGIRKDDEDTGLAAYGRSLREFCLLVKSPVRPSAAPPSRVSSPEIAPDLPMEDAATEPATRGSRSTSDVRGQELTGVEADQ